MAEPGKSLGEEKAVFELSVAHCVFNHFCTTYLQSVFFLLFSFDDFRHHITV